MKRPEVLNEEIYRLTPKGCAFAAMQEAELVDSMNDLRFKLFWSEFDRLMRQFGYIQEFEEEEECD